MKPVCICFGYQDKEEVIFNTLNGQVILSEYQEECLEVAKYCNGHFTLEEIAALSQVEITLVNDIVEFFLENQIVYDSTKLYAYYQQVTSNPMPFRNQMSPEDISALSGGRKRKFGDTHKPNLRTKSVRDYLKGYEHSHRALLSLFQNVFGKEVPEYPSAGGLYPVQAYLYLSRNGIDMNRGLYLYDFEEGFVRQVITPDLALIYKAFESHSLVEDSGAVVVLVANLEVSQRKYSNRSYRYACLEAGHIAQNFYQQVKPLELSACEYGGFCDEIIAQHFNLADTQLPITTLLLGKEDSENKGQYLLHTYEAKKTAYDLMQKYVPTQIKELQIRSYTYQEAEIPLFSSYTTFDSQGAELMAFGNDYSINKAVIKSIAEAIERKSSGNTRVDLKSTYVDNEKFLNPQEHYPLHPDYTNYSDFFTALDKTREYEWVEGESLFTGEKVNVLIDSVFYPFAKKALDRKPTHWASSNGVAAHTQRSKAIENALFELIERDALMVNWYTQSPVTKIVGNIPQHIKDRVYIWKEQFGYEIMHLNLTLDSLPVVVTAFLNPKGYPAFAAGAGCGYTLAEAIEKSFVEAEFMVTSWSENKQDPVAFNKVQKVHDHALLYFYPRHLDKLEYLLSSPEKEEVVFKKSTIDVISKFKPVAVDLKKPDWVGDILVVHLFSKYLMPINFGYGLEAYRHPRIERLGLTWAHDYPAFPHYFA